MATVTIPNPAVENEVRCDCIHLYNNLDAKLSDPPTMDELAAKYGRILLDRVLEPLDANGVPCGPRTRCERPATPTFASVAATTYTRPDGTTFTGTQMCWDLQIMADAHKADGLTPAVTE